MEGPDPLGPEAFCPEEFFRAGLYLACPQCGQCVVAWFGSDHSATPYWLRRMSLACVACGLTRSGDQAYDHWREGVIPRSAMLTTEAGFRPPPPAEGPAPRLPRADLWARTRCLGEEILALNPWHLTELHGYIAPRFRSECLQQDLPGRDWRNFLPDWMKSDANRAAVVQCLLRLRDRLADRPAKGQPGAPAR